MKKEPSQETIARKLITDRAVRRSVTRKSHFWFFHVFLSEYIKQETALFQREMLSLSEDLENPLLVIMAFRGSGKSTILNLSYVLWSILGVQQKKCVLIVSRTQNQAKNHFLNFKRELETNSLLRRDLGPFHAEDEKWGSLSLYLPAMDARIYAVCREQSIRGIRHGMHRPDLIICDDVEDTISTSEEKEAQTHHWFMSEVVPAGDERTRIVVLGNLTSKRSLLMRLKEDIDAGRLRGIFKAYPLLDDNDRPLWPERFPNPEAIEKLQKTISDEKIWNREYLLQIRPERLIIMWQHPDGTEVDDDTDLEPPHKESAPYLQPRRMTDYKISAPVVVESGIITYWFDESTRLNSEKKEKEN